MTKSRNEKENIITAPKGMKKFAWEYFKQLYVNKFDYKWTNSL